MNRSSTLHRLAHRVLPLVVLCASAGIVGAQNFNLPKDCPKYASGATDDPLYGDLPPVATITYNGGKSSGTVSNLQRNKEGLWEGDLEVPVGEDYLAVITYTPFLQSYVGGRSKANKQPVLLPAPGALASPQDHLYEWVRLQLYQPNTSKPLPGGILEMAPDVNQANVESPFSPYTMTADDKGIVTIFCYTAWRNGNPGTVRLPNGDFAYDEMFKIKGTDASLGAQFGRGGVSTATSAPSGGTTPGKTQ